MWLNRHFGRHVLIYLRMQGRVLMKLITVAPLPCAQDCDDFLKVMSSKVKVTGSSSKSHFSSGGVATDSLPLKTV